MSTIAAVEPIARTLGNIITAEPRPYGALTVVPLLAPLMAEPTWPTLAETGERVRITEVKNTTAVVTSGPTGSPPPVPRRDRARASRGTSAHDPSRSSDASAGAARELAFDQEHPPRLASERHPLR